MGEVGFKSFANMLIKKCAPMSILITTDLLQAPRWMRIYIIVHTTPKVTIIEVFLIDYTPDARKQSLIFGGIPFAKRRIHLHDY